MQLLPKLRTRGVARPWRRRLNEVRATNADFHWRLRQQRMAQLLEGQPAMQHRDSSQRPFQAMRRVHTFRSWDDSYMTSRPPSTVLPLQMAASSPLMTLGSVIPTTAAAVSSTSFFKLAIAFSLGGLFFSTAIAAVTATYAVGMDNVKRTLDLVSYVLSKVWDSFVIALGASRLALRKSSTSDKMGWFWRDAWRVFKGKLSETRRTAQEGVDAIRREAGMYAAAVGQPGLLPVQYVVDRLMPFSLATMLEESFKESIISFKSNGSPVKRLSLRSFDAGTKPPQLKSARIYDVPDSMAFDCVMSWNSEMDANIYVHLVGGLARLPVSIRNVRFDGVVRVILTPLLSEQPGYGATLISLPSLPRIGLDIRVAGGEVTRVPWLRSEIMNTIRAGMKETLLWPKRTVVPSARANGRFLLGRSELEQLEMVDPLLEKEKQMEQEQITLREYRGKSKPDLNSLDQSFNITLGGATSNNSNTAEMDQNERESHDSPRKRNAAIQGGLLWTSVRSLFRNTVSDEVSE